MKPRHAEAGVGTSLAGTPGPDVGEDPELTHRGVPSVGATIHAPRERRTQGGNRASTPKALRAGGAQLGRRATPSTSREAREGRIPRCGQRGAAETTVGGVAPRGHMKEKAKRCADLCAHGRIGRCVLMGVMDPQQVGEVSNMCDMKHPPGGQRVNNVLTGRGQRRSARPKVE